MAEQVYKQTDRENQRGFQKESYDYTKE